QKLHTSPGEARTLYGRSLRIVFLSMLPVLTVISLGAHLAISLWLGKEFADHSYVAVVILSLGILFNSTAQIPHAAIQANGNAKLTSLIHLGEFLLYAPLIYLLVTAYGIVGAACAWAGRAMIDFAALHYCASRMIGEKNER
ncbi:MAG: polysaccharide biosynthesis C-terminal domain-containing protein, partial [Steroidobacteraceae bacterium]